MDNRYINEDTRRALARRIASEAMVLLKNEDNALPLAPGTTAAIVGQTQMTAIIGGGGSGASDASHALVIRDELNAAGIAAEPAMDAFYVESERQRRESAPPEAAMDFPGLVASGLIYELFGKYSAPQEEPLPDETIFAASAAQTDTAIFILGRASGGEECDRRVEDDYYLTPSEKALLEKTCACFKKVIAVLNVNGLVDMAWAEQYPQVKALLLMGTTGEQAAGALADLLTGKATPSGKLAQTVARRYEDWPTARHITYNKDDPRGPLCYKDYGLSAEENGSKGFKYSPVTVYAEDVYVGYRYFDSFEKPVQYPFGFGLSYAEFTWKVTGASFAAGRFAASVEVRNTSDAFSGQEVVQLYTHAPFGKLEKPYQELRAVAKTKVLAPGEAETLELAFDAKDLAAFDEETGSYILEAGAHAVLIGNSSRDTAPAAALQVAETITVRRVTADIGMKPENRGKIELLRPERERPVVLADGLPVYPVSAGDVCSAPVPYPAHDFSVPAVKSTLADVQRGDVSVEAFVKQFSVPELAVLATGYGTGLPFMGFGKQAPMTIQYEDGSDIASNTHPKAMPGYCNPALPKYGIYSTWYKDGPASVGRVAWPTGMMLACTFSPALAREFGAACGCEAELEQVGSWLAPGLNLIRNPIEGRAFEYFSEDPFLCGALGTAIAQGAMEHNRVTVCPKHYALNEQETYRRGSERKNIDAVDTVVSARAARELYLKPFEMVLTGAAPTMLMSSFNKVNGTFAAGNRVLCTDILRGEWGFDGVVVTDWGDLDYVVDGADAVEAGNDVVMPGGPPVIQQILKGYEEGRVSLDKLREAAAHLVNYLLDAVVYQKD